MFLGNEPGNRCHQQFHPEGRSLDDDQLYVDEWSNISQIEFIVEHFLFFSIHTVKRWKTLSQHGPNAYMPEAAFCEVSGRCFWRIHRFFLLWNQRHTQFFLPKALTKKMTHTSWNETSVFKPFVHSVNFTNKDVHGLGPWNELRCHFHSFTNLSLLITSRTGWIQEFWVSALDSQRGINRGGFFTILFTCIYSASRIMPERPFVTSRTPQIVYLFNLRTVSIPVHKGYMLANSIIPFCYMLANPIIPFCANSGSFRTALQTPPQKKCCSPLPIIRDHFNVASYSLRELIIPSIPYGQICEFTCVLILKAWQKNLL